MREFLARFLKRAVIVAATLAACGYVLAEAAIMIQRMYGGQSDDNADVRWKAPLNMAMLGVLVLFVMEVVAFALRRKPPAGPVRPLDDIPIPPVGPPAPPPEQNSTP